MSGPAVGIIFRNNPSARCEARADIERSGTRCGASSFTFSAGKYFTRRRRISPTRSVDFTLAKQEYHCINPKRIYAFGGSMENKIILGVPSERQKLFLHHLFLNALFLQFHLPNNYVRFHLRY